MPLLLFLECFWNNNKYAPEKRQYVLANVIGTVTKVKVGSMHFPSLRRARRRKMEPKKVDGSIIRISGVHRV